MSGEVDPSEVMEDFKRQGNAAMAAAERLLAEGNKNSTNLYRQVPEMLPSSPRTWGP